MASVTPADEAYCYHYDAVGSTVAISDISQNVVNSYSYTPFGMILDDSETFAQPFKYVGQLGVMSEENGLYYMRARYYDPVIGLFISEDPLGFGGGDVNLYVYVGNDPVLLVDPTGLVHPSLLGAWNYYLINHPRINALVEDFISPTAPATIPGMMNASPGRAALLAGAGEGSSPLLTLLPTNESSPANNLFMAATPP